MSCVKIKTPVADAGIDLSGFAKQTKLESLSFIESIVSPDALEQILSFPKALTSLTLHEITHHGTSKTQFQFLKDDIETSHRALAQQEATLQEFDFAGQHDGRGVLGTRRSSGFDLSNLRLLSRLKLNCSDCKLSRPPPNLKVIVFEDLSPLTLRRSSGDILSRLPNFSECLRNASERNESLQLDLRLYRLPVHFLGRMQREEDEVDSLSLRQVFQDLGEEMVCRYALVEHPEEDTAESPSFVEMQPSDERPSTQKYPDDISLRLRVLTSKPSRYIPPYLHGEKGRRWVVRYDSTMLTNPYYDESGNPEGDDSSEDEHMSEAFRLDLMF